MAEGRALTDSGVSPEPSEPTPVLQEERAPAGPAVHVAVAAVLILGGFLIPRTGLSSVAWHAGVESAGIVLAAVLGALGLVRYYSRRELAFLYIGTGFLTTGVLDAFHLLLASGFLGVRELGPTQDLAAWSWLQSRLFLALFLSASVVAPLREAGRPESDRRGPRSVYLVALGLTLLVMAVFVLAPITRAINPDQPLPRPWEFLPAAVFLFAYVGYYRQGRWRTDPFEHWLLVSLLVSALLHAVYMARSSAIGDPLFDTAHVLKVASYGTVLVGLMVSIMLTFRREESAYEAVSAANAALGQEVTVRRDAEAVLQRSEERLQDFLDNAHDLIVSTAPDGRILYANAAWQRSLGYGEDDLKDLRLRDLLHPDSRDRVVAAFRQVLAGEDVRRLTAEFVGRDGRLVVCSGSATRHVQDGAPVSTQAIFRDVTEQRRAERELSASRANLTALVENTGDAIWSVDTRQRLVTFNSAFALAVEARSGREPRVGDPPEAVFGSGQAQWYRDLYERVLRGERFSALLEERLEGQERVVEIFCHPVLEATGTTGAVMFGKDVTRRLMAEEALRVAKEEAELANRAKSQFLASMSHELRTPLNSVIGFANILLKNKKENLTDQDMGYLDRVLQNGRHLLTLINEVLDLSKIEAGRMEVSLVDTDLGELIQETLAQLEGQAREKRVTLVADLPVGETRMATDPAKLRQVLINLVGNAMKFSEGGRVTVRLEMDPADPVPTSIAVEDTGVGIPQDRLEAIFEAFQQADAGTSRRYGGTGLGLTISRSICNLLGYELTVTSTVGRGSTFAIHFPREEVEVVVAHDEPESTHQVHDGPAPVPVPSTEGDDDDEEPGEPTVEIIDTDAWANRPAAGNGAGSVPVGKRLPRSPRRRDFRVLVVDDEADSRLLLSHYLDDLGCTVLMASSGSEGLQLAREYHPDLITLDLMMPGMSGWDTLRALKDDEDLMDIPVVVVSVVAAEGRGRLLGAVDLLSKPVDREDLLRVLWRNLVRQRTGRVLLVEDDDDIREVVSIYLEEAGLEVRAVANGEEALWAVEEDAPDAVVLDLMMPVMDGMTFLAKLRENPYHSGLPVVVLTAKDLSDQERMALEERATTVIPKGDAVEDRLRAVLGAFLPLQVER